MSSVKQLDERLKKVEQGQGIVIQQSTDGLTSLSLIQEASGRMEDTEEKILVTKRDE